jgi:hypothetical protein
MATIKRIICLANSRKLSGRCVAGCEIVGTEIRAWIRPVSDRPHEEVSYNERRYQDGGDPSVLDIIDIALSEPSPKDYQQENWLLDASQRWVKAGQVSWADLAQLADQSNTLWINGHSSNDGLNDRIPLDKAVTLTSSLKLIHVDKLNFTVSRPGAAFGNNGPRVRGWFSFSGNNYGLRVTDPVIERIYTRQGDGDYQLGECFLTISLGEPYSGHCYKLIAAVIQRG